LIRGNRALKKIIKTSLEEILNAELTGQLGIEKNIHLVAKTFSIFFIDIFNLILLCLMIWLRLMIL
jgi:hypothetical protein